MDIDRFIARNQGQTRSAGVEASCRLVYGRLTVQVLANLQRAIVDGYFPVLDHLSELIDDLEDRIIRGRQGVETLREVLELKRRLLKLRRVLALQRDVAN